MEKPSDVLWIIKSVLTVTPWWKFQIRISLRRCCCENVTNTKFFCIPFYMNYFLTDLCLPVCFFFSSDSLDWILIAWWFQFFSPMLLVAWFLCLFHLNSCKSTSCLKMLSPCFSKTTQEKKNNVFFPSLACLPLAVCCLSIPVIYSCVWTSDAVSD